LPLASNVRASDRLTVRLRLVDDTISDIRFEGQGCAISPASASLMTEASVFVPWREWHG
jgi:nitrogen fixation NifU-like protein